MFCTHDIIELFYYFLLLPLLLLLLPSHRWRKQMFARGGVPAFSSTTNYVDRAWYK